MDYKNPTRFVVRMETWALQKKFRLDEILYCKLKLKGGLWILELKDFNKTLLGKWNDG